MTSFLSQAFGGSWWIRTTEALRSRFTVCPHWPLGKAPLFNCFGCRWQLIYYSMFVFKMQALFEKIEKYFSACWHFAKVICPMVHNVADIDCSNPATWIYCWGKNRIYFYDAKGVSQPPEPCLSRQAGIMRCCLRFVKRNEILPEKVSHFGGSWWIRTTEALRSRFTVCPHWPLGKAPLFSCVISVSLTARLL